MSNGEVSDDVDTAATELTDTGEVVFSGSTSPNQPPAPFYDAGSPMNAFHTTLTVG